MESYTTENTDTAAINSEQLFFKINNKQVVFKTDKRTVEKLNDGMFKKLDCVGMYLVSYQICASVFLPVEMLCLVYGD